MFSSTISEPWRERVVSKNLEADAVAPRRESSAAVPDGCPVGVTVSCLRQQPHSHGTRKRWAPVNLKAGLWQGRQE